MEYLNIRIGQKLKLRGRLHGAVEAVVVQVDPLRLVAPIQVKVTLYPGEEPSLLWVNPDRLMESDR